MSFKRQKRRVRRNSRLFQKKKTGKAFWFLLGGAALLLLAAGVFFLTQKEKTAEVTVSETGTALPRLSFRLENGQEVNSLRAYTGKRNIPSYRGPIIANEGTHTLTALLRGADADAALTYEVVALSGEETFESGEIALDETEEGALAGEFLFGESFRDDGEVMLVLTLSQKNESPLYYYVRFTRESATNTERCVAFAYHFHDMTMDTSAATELSGYLESGTQADDPFGTVTLGSSLSSVQWEGMSLSSVSSAACTLSEVTQNYTSLVLSYTVDYRTESGTGTAAVREFYRVRVAGGGMKLLDFERTMEEIFQPEAALSAGGIALGFAREDVPLLANSEETALAFVQNGNLWLYEKETGVFTRIYPLQEEETDAAQQAHTVTPLSVDESGNVRFLYTGYVAGGAQAGEAGVLVGSYTRETNTVSEILFWPLFAEEDRMIQEFSGSCYYSETRNTVVLLQDGELYEVSVATGETESVSGDWANAVFSQENAKAVCAGEDGLRIRDLETGESRSRENPAANTVYRPYGYAGTDLVCGVVREEDAGTDSAGNAVTPAAELAIFNEDGGTVKTWQQDGTYITGVQVENGLLSITCAGKEGTVYTETETAYMTVHEEEEARFAGLETYTDKNTGTLQRIVFSEETDTTNAAERKAQLTNGEETVLFEKTPANGGTRYYAYGYGRLAGVYLTAGAAITAADSVSGVVASSEGITLWERGNRDLVYEIEGEAAGYIPEGNTDLSGVSAEELCYIIYKDHTVRAKADGGELLLYGYNRSYLYYKDLSAGGLGKITYEEADALFARNGSIFYADF